MLREMPWFCFDNFEGQDVLYPLSSDWHLKPFHQQDQVLTSITPK